jgi:hypothetical protein
MKTKEKALMDRETLIENINEDPASELQAIIQYITDAAKATGPVGAGA